MKLLALDTATELCSAALSIDGVYLSKELQTERGHAQRILPMIDALLTEAGVSLNALDAIAFGRGPGAFTGVRLAASVAQGLAFGADLPVAPVSDLAAVAQRAFDSDLQSLRVLVCNDARMQEVYWACFERAADGLASLVGEEHVGPATGVRLPPAWSAGAQGVGRGLRLYPELGRLVAKMEDDLLPRALEVARLAPSVPWLAAEHAIPVYLRDDVAKPPSRD